MSKTKSNSFYFFLLTLVLSLLLNACGSPIPKETTTYVATINNVASARVGIIVEDGKFVLYICSLDDAFNISTARWFDGELEADGTVAGVSPDGVKVNGFVNKDSFTGIITNLQGEVVTFRGNSVPAGGPAGLYHGVGDYNGQQVIVGAVVDANGVFISTVQVQGKIKFITPVSNLPTYITNSNIRVPIGEPSQKINAFLLDTIQGLDF